MLRSVNKCDFLKFINSFRAITVVTFGVTKRSHNHSYIVYVYVHIRIYMCVWVCVYEGVLISP